MLASPDLTWLTTASEKVAYFTALASSEPTDSPTAVPGDEASRALGVFPGTFPIGVDPNGRVVVLFLATVPWTDEFRTFLQADAALLRRAAAWTLRVVFPQPLDRVYAAYQRVIHEELETPLHRATINELKWYFEHRQIAPGNTADTMTQAFLDRAAQVFGTPRFTLLYRRWLKEGDGAFEGVSSPDIADALASGTARVECLVLPHTYRHLSPLASLVRSAPQGPSRPHPSSSA